MGGSGVFEMNSCYTAAELSGAQHRFATELVQDRNRDYGVMRLRHVARKKLGQDGKTVKFGKDKLEFHMLKNIQYG